MRHFTFQRERCTAVIRAVPLALSLGIGSLGAIAWSPTQAAAQGSAIAPSSLTVLDGGDQGELVVRLQQRLAELGFFSGEATGFYGPLTEEAVMRYQTAQGLIADGVAGPETLGALLPRSVASSAPSRPSQQLDNRQLQSVQAQLSRLGFYLGEVDGVYGPQTEAAINSFQSIYALPLTGNTDPLTLETLARVYSQADRQPLANQPPDQSAIGAPASFDSATASQVNFGSGQNFPSSGTQTQISTTRIALPPAIPSGPTIAADIPQTTQISRPLPPPSLPNRQTGFNSGNFSNGNFSNDAFNNPDFNPNFNPLPPLSSNDLPTRQASQFAAAPAVTGFPYVVAVPVKTGATLAEVRRAAANAFLEDSKRGTYIQAGAYNSREDAERATQALRDRRLDARVIYRPE